MLHSPSLLSLFPYTFTLSSLSFSLNIFFLSSRFQLFSLFPLSQCLFPSLQISTFLSFPSLFFSQYLCPSLHISIFLFFLPFSFQLFSLFPSLLILNFLSFSSLSLNIFFLPDTFRLFSLFPLSQYLFSSLLILTFLSFSPLTISVTNSLDFPFFINSFFSLLYVLSFSGEINQQPSSSCPSIPYFEASHAKCNWDSLAFTAQ
ncbi:unnamed protein product [Acanthosepion pharaonis]|uniref:Uncharacterized protein n=1 Tax=Acanthosepion pharaonis TaxID=158019 RepID=A0A812BSF6_ACAPH|nr:unnamed protein product [Sepia pharaonis]